MTEERLKRLFDRWYEPMVIYSLRYTTNYEVSRDIVGDAFLEVYASQQMAEDKDSALLCRIVRNRSIDYLRQVKRHREIQDFMSHTDKFAEEAAPINTGDVHRILDTLPVGQRVVMKMKFIQGFDYPQIAAALNITIDTCRVQVMRGLRFLRKNVSLQ